MWKRILLTVSLKVGPVVIRQYNWLLVYQSCRRHRDFYHVALLTVQSAKEGSVLERILQGFLQRLCLIHTSVIDSGELPKHGYFEKLPRRKCMAAQTGKLAYTLLHGPILNSKSQGDDATGAKLC